MQVTSTCARLGVLALRLFGRASWVGDSPLASLERD